MEIVTFLIPIALILAAIFIGGFIWMTLNGQYDDLETPGHRILLEDKDKIKENNNNNNSTQEGEL